MSSFILKALVKLLMWLSKIIALWALKNLLRMSIFLIKKGIANPRKTLKIVGLPVFITLSSWQSIIGLVAILFFSNSAVSGLYLLATSPESRDAFMNWMQDCFRCLWLYRRRWRHVISRCSLHIDTDEKRIFPELTKISSSYYWDTLYLKMLVGQSPSDFRRQSEALKHAFRASRISVQEQSAGFLTVQLMKKDPLIATVPAPSIPTSLEQVSWSALHIGMDEYLNPLTVSVLEGHSSVIGTSGAGKAGFIWNILRQLAPAIAAKMVRPIFIDPKACELRQAKELINDADYVMDAQDTLDLLTRLVDEMDERNLTKGLAGERDFSPSVEQPLVLICIDELAPLLAYWPRSIRDKIEDKLSLILNQGRSAGYIVIGAIQEPTKTVFSIRDLFQRRYALRLSTKTYTEAALADDAVEKGALCHDIPESLPGLMFILANGDKVARRARIGHVTDEDIQEFVTYVRSTSNVTSLDEHRNAKGKSDLVA